MIERVVYVGELSKAPENGSFSYTNSLLKNLNLAGKRISVKVIIDTDLENKNQCIQYEVGGAKRFEFLKEDTSWLAIDYRTNLAKFWPVSKASGLPLLGLVTSQDKSYILGTVVNPEKFLGDSCQIAQDCTNVRVPLHLSGAEMIGRHDRRTGTVQSSMNGNLHYAWKMTGDKGGWPAKVEYAETVYRDLRDPTSGSSGANSMLALKSITELQGSVTRLGVLPKGMATIVIKDKVGYGYNPSKDPDEWAYFREQDQLWKVSDHRAQLPWKPAGLIALSVIVALGLARIWRSRKD